jgi:hypothetical protein
MILAPEGLVAVRMPLLASVKLVADAEVLVVKVVTLDPTSDWAPSR